MFGCIKGTDAKKDIYISGQRNSGLDFARILVELLEKAYYNVFFDVEDLRSEMFNERHKFFIENCLDFILVLPRGALARCKNPDDWLRIKIEWAIKNNKNIIPIMLNGFKWPNPEDLPESLRNLQHYNALEYSHEYFDASMAILTQMLLSKPLSKNIHTLKL